MIKYFSCYSSYGQKEYFNSSTLNSPSPPKTTQSTKTRNSFYFQLCCNSCNNIKSQNKQETPAVPINLFIWQLRKAFLTDQLISVILFYFLYTARIWKKVKENHRKLSPYPSRMMLYVKSLVLPAWSQFPAIWSLTVHIQSYDKAKSVASVATTDSSTASRGHHNHSSPSTAPKGD